MVAFSPIAFFSASVQDSPAASVMLSLVNAAEMPSPTPSLKALSAKSTFFRISATVSREGVSVVTTRSLVVSS
jgi:hypothetical protein